MLVACAWPSTYAQWKLPIFVQLGLFWKILPVHPAGWICPRTDVQNLKEKNIWIFSFCLRICITKIRQCVRHFVFAPHFSFWWAFWSVGCILPYTRKKRGCIYLFLRKKGLYFAYDFGLSALCILLLMKSLTIEVLAISLPQTCSELFLQNRSKAQPKPEWLEKQPEH